MSNIRRIIGDGEISRYVAVLKSIPAVDQARIDEVRNNIKAGKYFSEDSAYKTAEKMMEVLNDLDA
ncbi:MAG: flagellar biosynthesis anti-sigma factor FlgM [Candidatus Omnitrophota bacterium]|jgi:hypothetical protein